MNKTLILFVAALVSQATAREYPDSMPAEYECDREKLLLFEFEKCEDDRKEWLAQYDAKNGIVPEDINPAVGELVEDAETEDITLDEAADTFVDFMAEVNKLRDDEEFMQALEDAGGIKGIFWFLISAFCMLMIGIVICYCCCSAVSAVTGLGKESNDEYQRDSNADAKADTKADAKADANAVV